MHIGSETPPFITTIFIIFSHARYSIVIKHHSRDIQIDMRKITIRTVFCWICQCTQIRRLLYGFQVHHRLGGAGLFHRQGVLRQCHSRKYANNEYNNEKLYERKAA